MDSNVQPREIPIHPSANRPHLVLGGDRELVLCAALLAAVLAFAVSTWWSFALAIVLWLAAVAVLARMGKADAQARGGQVDAAIASWKELVAQQSNDLPVDALLVELGRAYRAKGDAAEARKAFQQIVDQHPNSPYAPMARTELDGLSAS